MDEDRLKQLEELLGYHFSDSSIVTESVTHSSFADNRLASNERLEFLGDSVLALTICRRLFDQFPDYLEGDLTAVSALSEEQMGTLEPEAKAYFMEQGIDQRNYGMLDSLVSLLDENRVFAAVGALHLPGPSGLIQLLREKGYTLTPLPMPFIDAAQESSQQSPQ